MNSERFYRALLRLYPVRFREQYEREMISTFREDLAENGPSARHWLRTLADLALTVPVRLLEEAAHDLRHSLRVHARRPFVALFSVTALALGIGAATGLFGVLDAMLWRPLPFQQPDRLVALHMFASSGRLADSPGALHSWVKQSPYLKDASVFLTDALNVTAGGRTARLTVCESSASLFSLMGVPMAWGRGFLREEETPGRNDVAVISHALWDQAFGGDPRVLGQIIRLSGIPFRVVGVAPAGFDYPAKAQLWTPTLFEFDRIPKEGVIFWQVLGRLKDGLPLVQARDLYLAESARLAPKRMSADEANRSDLRPLQFELAGPARRSSLVLFGAVLCVLLIACGNVANLLLTRVLDRRKELQIRAALGASRARLFQQLLFESLALSLAAGLAGLAVAQVVARLAASLWPDQPPAPLDWRVLAFACVLSVLTGLVFGVLPAWHVSRLQTTNTTLRAGAAHAPGARLRLALTGLQVLLTLVLLAGGVQLGRLLLSMLHSDMGYQTAGVATLRVSVTGTPREKDTRQSAYYREALDRLKTLPGVETAGAVDYLPLAMQPIGAGAFQSEDGRTSGPAMVSAASPGYFDALQIQVIAGRAFRDSDSASSEPVALVTERTARELGGPAAILGRLIQSKMRKKSLRVVGVTRTVLHFGPGSEPFGQIYVPLEQTHPSNVTFVLKTRGHLDRLLAAARPALASVDTQVPVFAAQSMDTYWAERLAQPRMYTGALLAFGLFAGFLSILGLYATVAYSVSQRTHELGVRLALGGTPGLLRRLILRQSMPVVLAALSVGTAVALTLGRVLTALIYQARTVDWRDCATAALTLALVATLAVLLAARRIGHLNPARVLRSE
ncbi:ADOP family duplicated permease [uncultured Paludibaculum sp.]|uniref:ADOP family duplicated permease n=1 Tax=uncultured Paludibaculum sp. TaxID=1765020 RepID=UPI002AABD102|nr:ADOP family duplicated permease [uncultured Paludibaculum sp.]